MWIDRIGILMINGQRCLNIHEWCREEYYMMLFCKKIYIFNIIIIVKIRWVTFVKKN